MLITTQHLSSPQFQFLRPLLPVLVQCPGTTVSKHSNQFLQALVDIHDDREQLNTKLKSQTEASSTLPGSTPRSVGAAGLNEQSDTGSKVSRTWTSRLLFRDTFLRGRTRESDSEEIGKLRINRSCRSYVFCPAGLIRSTAPYI